MSLRKEKLSWIFIAALLLAVASAAYFVLWPQLQPHVTLRIGDGVFTARVVTANKATYANMPLLENKAILRIYSSDGMWPIDVRERHEQFDLVWLDSNKKVVHIVKNASSASLPSTNFTPLENARYVLELRGGTVDTKTIRINQVAYFDEAGIQELGR